MLHAVIMAGGKGTRFWPLSRRARPKQFLDLLGSKPMLLQTLERMSPLVPRARTHVAVSRELLGGAKKIIGDRVPRDNWIVEPVGRNTAPCLVLAALKVRKRDPDAVMVCLPSDHLIKPKWKFHATLRQASRLAGTNEVLVLLGIKPRFPSTGFGYIRRGRLCHGKGGYAVSAFIEKPTARNAQKLVASGNCSWNSGIFVWKASVFLEEVRRWLPTHYDALAGAEPALNTPREAKALQRAFAKIEPISIDYGVMQHSRKSAVILADFQWDDIGNWVSASRYWPKDANQNAAFARFLAIDAEGTSVYASDPKKVVAVMGMRDVIVVDTDDALLICPKRDSEKVRELVKDLAKRGWHDLL